MMHTLSKEQLRERLQGAEKECEKFRGEATRLSTALDAQVKYHEAYEKRTDQQVKLAKARAQHAERYIQQLLLQIQVMEAER